MGFPLFNNQPLNNYVSDTIEIGYTQYGPTLAISGVMSSTKKVAFVQKMNLNLAKKGDSKQYLFDWFAFRPHQANTKSYSHIDLKMPSKFMLTPTHPYKYNILFSDHNKYTEFNPLLKQIKKEWQSALSQISFDSVITQYQDLFATFKQKDIIIEAAEQLKEMSYWEKSDYSLSIIVILNDKTCQEMKKTFSLSSQDSETLRNNAINIIADLCKQSMLNYNLIFNPLK